MNVILSEAGPPEPPQSKNPQVLFAGCAIHADAFELKN